MLYQAVPKDEIAERLLHLRDLFRQRRPVTSEERLAYEKREAISKNLLDNLYRTKQHPTVRTVLDVAEIFCLTLDGAHRLFGYDLDAIRQYDLTFNGGRTHILDAYPYHRDFPIDLPLRLGSADVFRSRSMLTDLVLEWQTDLPIRVIDDPVWKHPGAFYVHVGTQDSFGGSLPPGATALVEPISPAEEARPDPRSIYLLQFGNGYRCSRCVVTAKKLFLISDQKLTGVREFTYPGGVRIAGRIRVFSVALPLPEYPELGPLPLSSRNAPLVLPWEHPSQDRLFLTKQRRFVRSRQEKFDLEQALEAVFATRLTQRTERRYRRPSFSQPHIDTLIQMVLSSTARYSDALRAAQLLPQDRGRFSLETLLQVYAWEDVLKVPTHSRYPEPAERWRAFRDRYTEWSAPLSMKYPKLHALEHRIVCLPDGANIEGLKPPLAPGTVLFLEPPSPAREVSAPGVASRDGWSRPLYTLRRGARVICGYMRAEQGRYALAGSLHEPNTTVLHETEVSLLQRVGGVIVPV